MTWLTPLGFLGLIGLIVWLIIYIIKPNYQQKIISSSYVWIKSLKYRKKKLPINKLRNILLILCQILTIIGIAMGLAQPIIEGVSTKPAEKIVVLDASADMLASMGGSANNRFERAIDQIITLCEEVTKDGGKISVILADNKPRYVIQRANAEAIESIYESMNLLRDPNDYQCTYGVADIDGAMKLAETVLEENPDADVVLYTGVTYTDPGDVEVVNVSDINEWNAAILKAEAVNVENFYEFRIDIASYGRDASIDVYMDVYGVNENNETRPFVENVLCTQEMGTVTLIFGNDKERAENEQNYILTDIYEYEYAYIHIGQDDSLTEDNTIYLYGGKKPELKIQYYSALPNMFYSGALMALRDILDDRWDIQLTEVYDFDKNNPVDPALEGFDVYIFEHKMPKYMPTDGLVILSNPDAVPSGGGFHLGRQFGAAQEVFLTGGEDPSPLMNGIDPEAISLTQYTQITTYDAGFIPLLYCGNDPVVLAKNENGEQVVLLSFSLHHSNLPVIKEFPVLLYNMLDHYVPNTVNKHLYEVSDTVVLNCRSDELEVEGPGVELKMNEFPNNLYVETPGVYTLTQTPISGIQSVESIYVKIPAAESNIRAVVDTLTNPYFERTTEVEDIDLVFWLAMALVALLFLEWWLQSKEYF